MCLIGIALLRAARVDMNVGDHGEAPHFAKIPKRAEMPPIKPHNASVQASWVEIVVQNEVDYARASIGAPPQKEGTTLSRPPTSTLAQPGDKAAPKQPRTGKLMLRREQAAHSLGCEEVHGRAPDIERSR